MCPYRSSVSYKPIYGICDFILIAPRRFYVGNSIKDIFSEEIQTDYGKIWLRFLRFFDSFTILLFSKTAIPNLDGSSTGDNMMSALKSFFSLKSPYKWPVRSSMISVYGLHIKKSSSLRKSNMTVCKSLNSDWTMYVISIPYLLITEGTFKICLVFRTNDHTYFQQYTNTLIFSTVCAATSLCLLQKDVAVVSVVVVQPLYLFRINKIIVYIKASFWWYLNVSSFLNIMYRYYTTFSTISNYIVPDLKGNK